VVAADGELMALRAADTMTWWSLEEAHRDLARACRHAGSVPEDRRHHFDLFVTTTRLSLAGRRGDLEGALEEARQLLSPDWPDNAPQCPEGDLRALTLVGIGTALAWASQTEEAARDLAQGAALARHAGYPYLELTALSHLAVTTVARSLSAGEQRGLRAVEFAERHGWGNEQPVGVAYLALAMATLWQARLEEAEGWLERAERALRPEVEPSAGVSMYHTRALWESVRGHDKRAAAALEDAESLRALPVTPHPLVRGAHALLLGTLVRAGETERADRSIDEIGEPERESGQVRIALAALNLAKGDPTAASAWLAPVLRGASAATSPWLTLAYLLEAAACDGPDHTASATALEHALDLVERDGALLAFLLHPLPELLERHRRRTSHPALVPEILTLVAGAKRRGASRQARDADFEPLSEAEARILRYLPTNLSAPEIANDLYLSVNTVKTHLRHLYAKLGVNRRSEAVERARALGLLAPPWHYP
jgi:LuxR family maltose regulon positive regulatory protein